MPRTYSGCPTVSFKDGRSSCQSLGSNTIGRQANVTVQQFLRFLVYCEELLPDSKVDRSDNLSVNVFNRPLDSGSEIGI